MATLRVLRQRARLTQHQLARRAGLRQSTVSVLELGKVPDPRISTVRRLARGLRMPVPVVLRAFPEGLRD